MRHFLAILAAGLCVVGAVFVQSKTSEPAPPEGGYSASARPLEAFPSAHNPQLDLLQISHPAPLGDTLSKAAVLSRLGRLYRYQSDVLLARAEGDLERAGDLLDRAMQELGSLMQQPGLLEQPRFRQVYRGLVTEYEAHYGVPDTLTPPRGSIFAIRDELFAAIDAAEAPLLEEAMQEDILPMETTVPMPINGLTRAAMRFLQRDPEDHVYRWMHRMETYFPMIEHIFAEEGVPDELKYLALAESGLNTQTVSPAGAAGMWQFMPATGRAYGLEINAWMDERLDPEKATRAAAHHLKDLYQLFGGDWLLALAGYNCSPTVIREALRRAERRLGRRATFWDIYQDIPRETRNYVPTYIAAALMLSNPQAFDLERVVPGPRYRFDRVPVEGMLPLETAAALAGTTVEKLRALNPALLRDTLPPSAAPYPLRLPHGTYARFAENYAQLPAEEKGLILTHRVQPGETLGGIAARYGTSAGELQRLNGLAGTPAPGDTLVVHATAASATPPALAAAEAVSVQYSTRTLRPIAPDGAPLPVERPDASQHVVVHRVAPGETLHEIARQHGVSVAELRQWNDLNSNAVRPGQQLKVYT